MFMGYLNATLVRACVSEVLKRAGRYNVGGLPAEALANAGADRPSERGIWVSGR